MRIDFYRPFPLLPYFDLTAVSADCAPFVKLAISPKIYIDNGGGEGGRGLDHQELLIYCSRRLLI